MLLWLLLLAAAHHTAHSHSRWECPAPRSSSTGIKNGPCGTQPLSTFQTTDTDTEVKPGPLRIIFEESIHHTGAPFRISLSNDGTDDDACVLMDHIPHNDCCRPNLYDESSYTKYVLTIDIPNVKCERCSLHLSNPMTDKIGNDGAPSGIGCTDPDGSCFSVYHSCTVPFRIVGDENAVQRGEYTCPDWRSVNKDWPMVWVGDNGQDVDVTTSGVYRRESSVWSDDDFTLATVSDRYRLDAGGLCGEQKTAEEVAETTTYPTTLSSTTVQVTSTSSSSTTSSETTSTSTTSAETTAASLTSETTTTTSTSTGGASMNDATATEAKNESNESTTQPTAAGFVGCSPLFVTQIVILIGTIMCHLTYI